MYKVSCGHVFIFLGCKSRDGIAGSYGNHAYLSEELLNFSKETAPFAFLLSISEISSLTATFLGQIATVTCLE